MSHKKYRSETNCLNCGENVTGKFCSNCGQENIEVQENFLHLAGHFIADYLHFDSKFFRSLIPLFTKPGFLTKEYWQGRRVHYIHPLRLFFFITIVFMIVATFFYNSFGKTMEESITNGIVVETPNKELTTVEEREKADQADKEEAERMRKRFAVAIDTFYHNLKYVSFLLLPVYAFIFKLLYSRRKTFYVDHLVYTIHLQSFAYVLMSIMFLLVFLFPEGMGLLRRSAIFILFIYIIFSLHFLYNQSWGKTIFKSFLATFLLVLTTSTAFGIYLAIDYLAHN